jgi:hypothetical protein
VRGLREKGAGMQVGGVGQGPRAALAGRSDALSRAAAKYGGAHSASSPPRAAAAAGGSSLLQATAPPAMNAPRLDEPAMRGYDAEAGRAAGVADDDMAAARHRGSGCVVM